MKLSFNALILSFALAHLPASVQGDTVNYHCFYKDGKIRSGDPSDSFAKHMQKNNPDHVQKTAHSVDSDFYQCPLKLCEWPDEQPCPTSAPKVDKIPPVVVTGDPHFTTFGGHKYDYHGGCDSVLLHNPGFQNGKGLTIQIRTKIENWWSSTDAVAVRIGEDTLEVQAGWEDKRFWVNGAPGDKKFIGRGIVPFTIGGNRIRSRIIDEDKKHRIFQFKILLPANQAIVVKSVNHIMRVEIDQADQLEGGEFKGSMGLLGSIDQEGSMVARDGATVFSDSNEFGQEWQVLESESMLFHEVVGVQHPEKCAMPDKQTVERRQLRGSNISREEAERACLYANPADKEDCISDVMLTEDLYIAGAF